MRCAFFFHGWIDVSDLSAKAAVRHVGELDDGLLADLEERQVLLVNFSQNPDFANVANAIEGLPGFRHRALQGVLFDDHAVPWRDNLQGVRNLMGLSQIFDLPQ